MKLQTLAVVCAFFIGAMPAFAAKDETKGTIDGPIKTVLTATETAFEELDIQLVDSTSAFVYAMAVGKAATGSRLVVSIHVADKNQSTVTITSDTPKDPELEQKLLESIQENL